MYCSESARKLCIECGDEEIGSVMRTEAPIREGQVLSGPLFNEPMRVETVRPSGTGVWEAGLVGQQSEQFRRVVLGSDDVSCLTSVEGSLPRISGRCVCFTGPIPLSEFSRRRLENKGET